MNVKHISSRQRRSTRSLAQRASLRDGARAMLLVVTLAFVQSSCVQPPHVECTAIIEGQDGQPNIVTTYCDRDHECSLFGDFCVPIDGCGNGRIDGDEVCDDGNVLSRDGCREDCLSDETCGNEILDPGEACDDGEENVDPENAGGGTDGCSTKCFFLGCGDGNLDDDDDDDDEDGDEECDDGNNVDGDGCSADCQSREECGDDYINYSLEETCDDGNLESGDGCSDKCFKETCGNGELEPQFGEVCEDGNNEAGDGCSANCRSNEVCGNGILDRGVIGEECDDGNTFNGDGCNSECQLDCPGGAFRCEVDVNGDTRAVCIDPMSDERFCGADSCQDMDSACVAGERCENGVCVLSCPDNLTMCDDMCVETTLDPDNCGGCGVQCAEGVVCSAGMCASCGNGIQEGNEDCDGDGMGTGGETATCDVDCTMPMCRDGVVNYMAGEQCDTVLDSPFCDYMDCTLPECGDGTVNTLAGESCDDGNSTNFDTCSNGCLEVTELLSDDFSASDIHPANWPLPHSATVAGGEARLTMGSLLTKGLDTSSCISVAWQYTLDLADAVDAGEGLNVSYRRPSGTWYVHTVPGGEGGSDGLKSGEISDPESFHADFRLRFMNTSNFVSDGGEYIYIDDVKIVCIESSSSATRAHGAQLLDLFQDAANERPRHRQRLDRADRRSD